MQERKRILITGASGLVGSRLTEILQAHGHEVWHLSRGKSGKVKTFQWDVDSQEIDKDAFEGVDTIVHLAGASVAEKRWTARRKQEISDSRVKSTRLLFNELRTRSHKIKSFISASAIGYYGFKNPEAVFTESSPPGNDFLATVTKEWETEADKIATLGLRVVKMRVGVVLARNGGALQPIAKAVKMNVGSALGSGQQLISWIHLDDLCNMFVKVIDDQRMEGPYNAVALHPVSNHNLTKAIAAKLGKPFFLPPVPGFLLKVALGEMADIVVNGSHVAPRKMLESGFTYKFPSLNEALTDVLT